MGTGSGCIAIALKKILTSLEVDALDISKEAIELAKKNAHQNKVSINFIEGNMEDPLSKKYDVIISNPPYIDYGEEIMDIVKNNEPHIALYAKENGIYYYHKIIKNLKNNLPNNYLIAFEIGHTHVKGFEMCKVIIDNVIKKRRPKTQNIYLLTSHIRISTDDKYKQIIEELIQAKKSKGKQVYRNRSK